MNKKVAFGARPERSETTPDDWVANRGVVTATVDDSKPKEPTKRLTIDVSADLHRRIKVGCAIKGSNIADELREILERHFPEQSSQS